MSLSNRVPAQIREEAAEWFIALREEEVDASGRKSFDQWLRTSPDHVRAFLRISALWQGADVLVTNTATGVSESTQPVPREQPTGSSPTWHKIAACILLAGMLAAGAVWWLSPRTLIYESGAGELRTVTLPDGSTVQINARSRIESTFSAKERAVELVTGEALFSVAIDATRPFSVRSDPAGIRAVGTRFDVYRKGRGTVVTVVQGAVSVRNAEHEVLVSEGEQTTAGARAPLNVHSTNVPAAIAWTEGQLVFDLTPLRDVVAEFNRVGLRRLVLEDSTLLDLHISGTFPAHDPSSLIAFLRARFGVTIEETNEQVRIRRTAKK
jgi:transmembrane sensor